MINTNDGYYFASGAQQALFGMHMDNPRIPSVWSYGTVALTVLLAKITPFSLETITLYLPAIVSSLVVIPIILIGRLFGMTWWGFFSALLGAVVWSYYNRTMVGYYDTDMFSAMAPMFILYFLMKSTMDMTLRSALIWGEDHSIDWCLLSIERWQVVRKTAIDCRRDSFLSFYVFWQCIWTDTLKDRLLYLYGHQGRRIAFLWCRADD